MAFSLTYTPALAEGTVGVMRTLALIAFLYGTQVLIETRQAVNIVVISMGASMIGGAVLAVAQIMSEKFYLPASFVIAVGANAPRATGTFHNPNTFGTFLMCGVVFLFALLVNHRFAKWKAIYLIASLAAAGAGLVHNLQSFQLGCCRRRHRRGTDLCAQVALPGVGWVVRHRDHSRRQRIRALRRPHLSALCVHFLHCSPILVRLGGSPDLRGCISSSLVSRCGSTTPSWGLDGAPFHCSSTRTNPLIFRCGFPTKESHTLAANMLAELGLVGITASAWIVWRVFGRGMEGVRQATDPYLRAVLVALLCVFLSFQVSLSATADFSNNFLWFFTGMIFAVIHLIERERSNASP